MLEVKFELEKGIPLVTLKGRFDGLGGQVFDREAGSRAGEYRQWVIDAGGVSYLSSAGIRSLMKLVRDLRKSQGEIFLVGLAPQVKSVLELSGLLSFFSQAAGTGEALSRLSEEKAQESARLSLEHRGREFFLQVLSGQEASLDIWGQQGGEAEENHLFAVPLDELAPAFGIGGLGEDRAGALEGAGAFVSLGRGAGVVPADGHNQGDYLVTPRPGEALLYLARAASFTGKPWGRLTLGEGDPLSLRELGKGIARIVEGTRGRRPPLVGMVFLARSRGGEGTCYRTLDDLAAGRCYRREISGGQGLLLAGLWGSPGWEEEPLLSPFLEYFGIESGEGFFQGTAFVLSRLPEGKKLREPGEALDLLQDFQVFQDVLQVGQDLEVTGGTAWLYLFQSVRPGEEKLLKVELVGEGTEGPQKEELFPDEWEIITRRLYAEAARVIMEPLKGGYSSALPFRVTSYDRENRRMQPTVLKLGPEELVEQEKVAHQKYVEKYILNNSTAIMGTARQGGSSGIRYNFVGISGPDSSLTWLTHHYLERPVEELLPLFDRVFTRVLKPWYGQPRLQTIRPFREHNPLASFPSILEDARQELGISPEEESLYCPGLGMELPNPYHYLKYRYPEHQDLVVPWYTGIVHGDLNMQNILLDERENIYIIDFSDTGIKNIVSDFARLEPIFRLELTRLGGEEDLVHLLEMEEGLSRALSLEEEPPFFYRGSDPMVEKAYRMTCRIREYARRTVIFETSLLPYLLAVLEWVFPIVSYISVNTTQKKLAAYSAGLILRQLEKIRGMEQGRF